MDLKPYIYGLSPYVNDEISLRSDLLFEAVGGNTGNLLFTQAVCDVLGASPTSLGWGDYPDQLPPGEKCLIMPLANQLRPNASMTGLVECLNKMDLPIVGIGLGADYPLDMPVVPEYIPDESWNLLKAIISKSPTSNPNVGLRGDTTMEIVKRKGLSDSCITTGCPSLFLNSNPLLGATIKASFKDKLGKIGVAAGNNYNPSFRQLERSLVRRITRAGGEYIVQHPKAMFKLALGDLNDVTEDDLALCRDYLCPDLTLVAFMQWMKDFSRIYFNVGSWVRSLKRFDMVVGTRIHGIMAGLAAAVPSVCLYIDSRTKELCDLMRVPCVRADEFVDGVDVDFLYEYTKAYDWDLFDYNRRILAEKLYTFLEFNRIIQSGKLEQIFGRPN